MLKKMFFVCILSSLMMVSFVYSEEAQITAEKVAVEKVTDHISVLKNGGGNIGVYTDENGVLVIDTMMKSFSDQMKKALSEIAPGKMVRFVINTHWHYDHVECNEVMAKEGAIIIAHENVRKGLSTDQYIEFFSAKIPPAPAAALPMITFAHDITLYMGQEDVYVVHVQTGHTDGDAIVFFRKANVVHLGDLCFAGMYPFIDTSSGGSITNIITVLRYLLPMLDDSTKIIPGHGPVINKSELKAYIAMLTAIREKFLEQIKTGKTLEEMISGKATQEFDAVWGQGFLKSEAFTKLLYSDLIREK